MRNLRETVGSLGLSIMVVLVVNACMTLPPRIPIHFDLTGKPNGWGSPHVLLWLPGIAITLWLFLTVIARFPQTFNYPVDVTPELRTRLAPLAADLIGWIKLEVIWTFVLTTWTTVRLARGADGKNMLLAIVLASFAAIASTVGLYIARMRRLAC